MALCNNIENICIVLKAVLSLSSNDTAHGNNLKGTQLTLIDMQNMLINSRKLIPLFYQEG
jgi:hypothetical protein